MKVRMKTIMAGPDNQGRPGQIVEVDAATGIELAAGGFADIIERGPDQAEKATISPQEKADIHPQGRRGKKS